jgi:hypothetical protein
VFHYVGGGTEYNEITALLFPGTRALNVKIRTLEKTKTTPDYTQMWKTRKMLRNMLRQAGELCGE